MIEVIHLFTIIGRYKEMPILIFQSYTNTPIKSNTDPSN